MIYKQLLRCYFVLALLVASTAAWTQSSLMEEASVPVDGDIREVIPCPEVAQSNCMAGLITVEDDRDPEFNFLDNFGQIIWRRPAKRFREAWIKDNRDTVLVEHDESGKGFTVRRFAGDGKEISQFKFGGDGRDTDEFDYNAAGSGAIFASNTDQIIFTSGEIRQRPTGWKKTHPTPLYWYLLPDASIIASSGRSDGGAKEETIRVTLDGTVQWRYAGTLTLPDHVRSRAIGMPKYLLEWGVDKRSLALINAASGEHYWNVAASSEAFGISLISTSPSERYMAFSLSKGGGNIEVVLADTLNQKLVGVMKLPEGLESLQFNPDESAIYALRKLWARDGDKIDALRGKKVRVKVRTEKWGLDLKPKMLPLEIEIDAKSLQSELVLLPTSNHLIVTDKHSKRLRLIKQRE